jgi:sugar-phosphatase
LGAERLGVAPEHCLAFEDTLAGLTAAESAGMDAVVITATHSHVLDTDAISVLDYDDLRAVSMPDGMLRLERKV